MRTSHPVVLRANTATGSTWYETSRGVLAASAEATAPASGASDQTQRYPPGTDRIQRKPNPVARRHSALARARYRCERCGATTRLEVDPASAVCDRGADGPVQVLCRACHLHKRAGDIAADPRFIRSRAAGISSQERRKAGSS